MDEVDIPEIGVMLDLETLAQYDDNAAIASIGAQAFRRDQQIMLETFEITIELQSILDSGGTVEGGTICWWMLQRSDEERARTFGGSPVDVREAMERFKAFLDSQPGKVTVWGNGRRFDNVIVSNTYRRLGMAVPWGFREDRCYRTIKSEAPEVAYPRDAIAHCALADAKAQVEHLFEIDRYRSAKAVLQFLGDHFPWTQDPDQSVNLVDAVNKLRSSTQALRKIAG